MGTTDDGGVDLADKPWQQQVLESPWLLAGAALLYFLLSYVVWGVIDLLTVPTG